MRLWARRHPEIAANFTFGMQSDRRGVAGVGGSIELGHQGALRVMAGTLLGVLLRVNCTCVRARCLQETFVGGIGCGHDWWGIRNSTKQWHPLFRRCDWHPLFRQGVMNGTGSKLWVVCWEEPLVERVRE